MSIYDRVLITGGEGMLARALGSALRARSVEPIALDHLALDITNPDAVDAAFQRHRPTLVLNCAAYTNVDRAELESDRAEEINGKGALVIGMMSADYLAACVHFSTDFVFDGAAHAPYRPTDPTNPLSVYGLTKLSGERQLQQYSNLTIRTSWLYGPGGPNFVQTMLKVARAGKPLKVVHDQIGSPTFTHDLADATLSLIDNNARGIFHATNSGQTTWFDFARAIFEEFDVQADLSPTTSVEWKAQYPNSAPRPAYSVLDCSETERVIGRPMPDWRDGLRRYRALVEPRPL